MSWDRVEIGNFVTLRQGFAINKNTKHHMADEITALPLLRIADMKDGSQNVYVKDTIPPNFIAKADDIIYTRTGQVGLVFTNQYGVVHNNCFTVSPNDEKVLCRPYLFYALQNKEFYEMANSKATGAAQPDLPHGAFNTIPIFLPPIETQRRIADILSAYDNLIENNQKQIKLLEEAAQRLYKEWFVELRFPGHENTKIVDGVPEGWVKRRIEEFGEVITGKTPSTTKAEYYDGNIPFVTIPDMHNKVYPLTTEKNLTKLGADTQKNKYLPAHSVIVSCIATVGLVNITAQECQTNQQINAVVLENEYDLYFFYESMKRLKEMLGNVGSNGATMTNVNKTKFSNLEVLYPTTYVARMYYKFCKPLFENIFKLSKAINAVRQARDRLLPKLMSGELEV